MCGFVSGVIPNIEKQKILTAIKTIEHRGPDSFDFDLLNDISGQFLAHARLSIVGVSNGRQPLTNNSKTVWAVVNGEFYGWQKIKNDLIAKGHKFNTNSDSEILVFLYEEYGFPKALDFLEGEFAFALYDKTKGLWFAGRDIMGIRPLVYSQTKNGIIFSSEAKALFALGISPELDVDSFYFSQYLQYTPQNKSLFAGVNTLPPSHFMQYDEKTKEVNIIKYWSYPASVSTDSIDTASDKIEYLLNEAVSKRIPQEVNWACHLSGGIDSSIVSALAAQASGQRVNCFTVSFTDDDFYNEAPLAKIIAQHIGAQHHIVELNFEDMINAIPQAVWHAEGLSINGHIGAKYLLNKSIHDKGFKVALSGEGSDEIFMGYSHLKQDWLGHASLNTIEKTYLSGAQLPQGDTLDLNLVNERLSFIPTWMQAKASIANKLSFLWSKDFKAQHTNLSNPQKTFLMEFESDLRDNAHSKLKVSSSGWARYCLSSYILKILDDAQASAHGVEGRLPFLDKALLEYVWTLPDSYFFNGNIEKSILRQKYKRLLPIEVIEKTKQSFMSAPMTRALSMNKTNSLIVDSLFNGDFLSLGLFDKSKIEQFLNACRTNPHSSQEAVLMTLFTFSILCNKFKLKR